MKKRCYISNFEFLPPARAGRLGEGEQDGGGGDDPGRGQEHQQVALGAGERHRRPRGRDQEPHTVQVSLEFFKSEKKLAQNATFRTHLLLFYPKLSDRLI